jgi:hypothetical protein
VRRAGRADVLRGVPVGAPQRRSGFPFCARA